MRKYKKVKQVNIDLYQNIICLKYQENLQKQLFLQIIKQTQYNFLASERLSNSMISKNIIFINKKSKIAVKKQNLLLSKNLYHYTNERYNIVNSISLKMKEVDIKNKSSYFSRQYQMNPHLKGKLVTKNKYFHSSQPKPIFQTQQSTINYNNYQIISQLNKLSLDDPQRLFYHKKQPIITLSNKYKTIAYEIQQKYELLQRIIHSNQLNLYKIMEQIFIVFEGLLSMNRKQLLEDNLSRVLKQFNNKLISAYLQNLQVLEEQQRQSKILLKKDIQQNINLNSKQQNDNDYSLHQNYTTLSSTNYSNNQLQHSNEYQTNNISTTKGNILNIKFIYFYIQSIKDWVLNKIDNQTIIMEIQEQMLEFLNAREVSNIQDLLEKQILYLQQHYINQPNYKKRQLFSFQKKLRSISLIPYFKDKSNIDKYLNRLTQQNLIIFLKQSQLLNLMHDIVNQKVAIIKGDYVYHIQSTKIYQLLSTINTCYIKSQFIDYVRKFMVCYQEIQFYQIFKQLEAKLKFSSVKSFIRALKILKSEAVDLHCQYNKTMNKYNFNIMISIIMTQQYTIQNTKLDDLLDLFENLNSADKAGEIMYEQISRFLRQFMANSQLKFAQNQSERLFNMLKYAIEQAKPVQKYDLKDGLNKQFTKRTYQLVSTLLDAIGQEYPVSFIKAQDFIKFYVQKQQYQSFIQNYQSNDVFFSTSTQGIEIQKNKMRKIGNSLKMFQTQPVKFFLRKNQKIQDVSLAQYLSFIKKLLQKKVSKRQKSSQKSNQNTPQNTKQNNTQKKVPKHSIIYEIMKTHNNSEQINAKNLAKIEYCLFKDKIEPLLKQFQQMTLNSMLKKDPSIVSSKDKTYIYQNLLIILEIITLLSFSQENQSIQFINQVKFYLKTVSTAIFIEMKQKIVQRQTKLQKQRIQQRKFMSMSLNSHNNTMLICLQRLSKIYKQLYLYQNALNQVNLSSSSAQAKQFKEPYLTQNLPLIYNFMNKISISDFKNINKIHIADMLIFINKIQTMKSAINPVLLIDFDLSLYEFLYYSLSMYILNSSQRGKMYLRMNLNDGEKYLQVINHFIEKKDQFKKLKSKRKIVPLQVFMSQLIKKKVIKFNQTHLKRSQYSHMLLSFLQIFGQTQNLIVDLKNQVQEIQFVVEDLQDFSLQFLEQFSEINTSISKYLEDNKFAMTSTKRLYKMSKQQLRKQFQSGRSSKIYELILKNHKFKLPFQLPQPQKKQQQLTKIMYVLQKIYKKIQKKTKYKAISKNNKQTKLSQKNNINKKPLSQMDSFDLFTMTPQKVSTNGANKKSGKKQISSINQPNLKSSKTIQPQIQQQKDQQYQLNEFIDLQPQTNYIKKQSLIQHTYQQHYKMNQNTLNIFYRKQTWKNYQFVYKDDQIQAYEIDQKINQNIYKDILKAFIGYVEKVKKVTKQFHPHSFIQYVVAQLELQIIYHGCIARISRKNKPQDNILFVCATQSNYKLMYICTHILRQSGENVYILNQHTRQADFKQFLQANLPQSYESQQPQIVQKVLKRGIALGDQQIELVKQQ